MLHLPRWCSLAGVYYFAPEERLKDAEREMKIRKMGMDCSNRLGSTSPPNEAILHFPVGAGRAAVHSSAPRLEAAGSPTFLWINHALGALTAGAHSSKRLNDKNEGRVISHL